MIDNEIGRREALFRRTLKLYLGRTLSLENKIAIEYEEKKTIFHSSVLFVG